MESNATAAPAPSANANTASSTSQTRNDSRNGKSERRNESGRDSSSFRGSNSNNFSRGRGGSGRGGNRGKKRDMGRSAWSKQKGDKRQQNDEEKEKALKRRKLHSGEDGALPVYATKFTEEEVKAEDRRPKKKVAVMIGYSGTGYKGMQLAHDQKTIEGDLFKAFVAAGAISKANADDPKKSSFVRCARTDKGVHAAGNVISLKLIVEDENIIQKINDNLASQIRVWGFERTNNSFSAYQLVDSRIYEYLIPTHSFLPPHPRSYMGKKCVEWAEKQGVTEEWKERQKEVEGYWEKVDEEAIRPILEGYDEDIRSILEKAIWLQAEQDAVADGNEEGVEKKTAGEQNNEDKNAPEETEGPLKDQDSNLTTNETAIQTTDQEKSDKRARAILISEAVKKLRQAYVSAKRSYRIPAERLQRVRESLNLYTGTRNYHNYTVQKDFKDASAKRVIKSFVVDSKPILINGTEWLSLKVHGQSFMMHQIRKMVGMVALVVRCGCDPQRIVQSYGKDKISIPKAPSLGLLLERPVFDTYNKRAQGDLGKETIDFEKYETEMEAFKQREIYERMYADEEKENVFGNFFNHVDNFPSETFLFVTAGGVEATRVVDGDSRDSGSKAKMRLAENKSGDEDSDADDVKDEHGNEG